MRYEAKYFKHGDPDPYRSFWTLWDTTINDYVRGEEQSRSPIWSFRTEDHARHMAILMNTAAASVQPPEKASIPRRPSKLEGEMLTYYEWMLEEIQASFVLAGASKMSIADLEKMNLGEFLDTSVRNRIRYRFIYHPRKEELPPPKSPPSFPKITKRTNENRIGSFRYQCLKIESKCPKCGNICGTDLGSGDAQNLTKIQNFFCYSCGDWTEEVDWGKLLDEYISWQSKRITSEY